ncbi:MAG: SAF domain-containing protein [Candidatus Melainabacteria bacterium]|nr:SAF domain-containing protein [Candidatus Melainabacteria bacterium]
MKIVPFRRRLSVLLIVLLLSTIPRCVQAANFEGSQKKVIQDSAIPDDQLPRTLPVAFTTRKIAKGHVFTAADVEERKINIDQVPSDAVISCRKLVGRKSLTSMNAREVVSIQDLGFGVTESQIAGMTARDWGKFREKMGSVCYTKVAIKPGEKLKTDQIVDHKMPLRIVPCDAVTHSSLVAGRTCKFGCAKRHIIMQHDLF